MDSDGVGSQHTRCGGGSGGSASGSTHASGPEGVCPHALRDVVTAGGFAAECLRQLAGPNEWNSPRGDLRDLLGDSRGGHGLARDTKVLACVPCCLLGDVAHQGQGLLPSGQPADCFGSRLGPRCRQDPRRWRTQWLTYPERSLLLSRLSPPSPHLMTGQIESALPCLSSAPRAFLEADSGPIW